MSGDGEFPPKSRKVPAPDATRNYFEEEVIGNKTDAAVTTVGTTKSLQAYAKGTLNQLSSIITLLGQVIDVHQNVVSWSDVDRSARFEISLIDKDSGGIPSGNITAGTYVISRFREFDIASFADAGGGDVTATTTENHGFSNGETVVISGTTNYDGSYVMSGVTADTFTFTATWVATETGNCGAWQEIVGSTAFSKDTGLVYLDYVFENGDWATDDNFKVTPTGISVVIGGNTYYPAVTTWMGTIQDVSTIEGKIDTIDGVVDAIQTDIGDPSSRTNFQNIEDMIGVPDAVNSSVDDILRTGLDSSAITNNFDGSILEVAKSGLEKDTAGAFDADTDSNEAISEAVAGAISTVDEIPSETNAKTFNATALQSIQDEAEDALEGEDLDHFLMLDGATQKYPENCATDSILAKVLVKADPAVPSQYDNSTDSLEAIRDRIDTLNVADQIDLDAIIAGVITNATGADVATDVVALQADLDNATDGLGALKILIDALQTDLDNGTDGLGALKALIDAIQTDLDNGTDGLGALKALIDANQTDLDAIIVDTEDIQTQVGVAGAGLTAIPDMALDSTVAKEASLGELASVYSRYWDMRLVTPVSDVGNTVSTFKTDLSSAVDDVYKDMEFVFLSSSGPIARRISAYNGTTKFITVDTPFSSVPLDSNSCFVVPVWTPDVIGADGDTLETLSDQLDLQATSAEITALDGVVDAGFLAGAKEGADGDTLETLSDQIDGVVTDIGTVDTVVDANQDYLDGTTATPNAYRREYGVTQVKEVSITAAANAGVTTVATITDQPCLIKSVVIHADAAQTGDMTTCAVEGGTGQVVEFIGVDDATQANLDAADKQVGWTGVVRLASTKTITIDLQGTGATAVDLTVSIEYMAAIDGGYLA